MEAKGNGADAPGMTNIEAILTYAGILADNGWVREALRQCLVAMNAGGEVAPALKAELVAASALFDPTHQDLGAHRPLMVLRLGQLFSTLHFSDGLPDALKKVAFKSGVGTVAIETSAQCNRQCAYCPNSRYDRRQADGLLDYEAFERVIDDLAAIGYNRLIAPTGLNEPLLHLDDFTARLMLIRSRLPKARIVVSTNGDFLDREAFDALVSAGANEIDIAAHLTDEPYSEAGVLARVQAMGQTLGLTPILADFEAHAALVFRLAGSDISVVMRLKDYARVGHNWGGTLPEIGPQTRGRTAPCLRPLDNFVITHKGDVAGCIPTGGTSPEVADCIFGNVGTESIFDVYCGPKMVAWRRQAMTTGAKRAPCATCPEVWPGLPVQWDEIAALALAGDGQ